jgi:Tfp pilus assembly protein PilF
VKPLQNAGICATQQKNYPLAESYLLRAQQQEPGLLSVQFHLAQLYLKMQDAARASVYTRRILTTNKPTAETLWLGIRASHMLGDQVLKNQLVQALKTDFITSPQWAAYSRNFFEE